MPVRQRDRGMVRMTDSASSVNARISALSLPTPLRRLSVLLQEPPIVNLADTVRVLRTHVDEFAGYPVEELYNVRLTCTASQRFVLENGLLVYAIASPRWRRNEEPFALTAKSRVLAAITQSGWNFELILAGANNPRL